MGAVVLFALGILLDSFLTLVYVVKALYVDPVTQGMEAPARQPVGCAIAWASDEEERSGQEMSPSGGWVTES